MPTSLNRKESYALAEIHRAIDLAVKTLEPPEFMRVIQALVVDLTIAAQEMHEFLESLCHENDPQCGEQSPESPEILP